MLRCLQALSMKAKILHSQSKKKQVNKEQYHYMFLCDSFLLFFVMFVGSRMGERSAVGVEQYTKITKIIIVPKSSFIIHLVDCSIRIKHTNA